jgi:hypothetical protein
MSRYLQRAEPARARLAKVEVSPLWLVTNTRFVQQTLTVHLVSLAMTNGFLYDISITT